MQLSFTLKLVLQNIKTTREFLSEVGIVLAEVTRGLEGSFTLEMHLVQVVNLSEALAKVPQNSENEPRGLYFSKALFEGLMFGGKFASQNRLG